MPISVREILSNNAQGTTITFNTSSATAVNDVLLLVHATDYYVAADMPSPGGTAGTWTDTGDTGDLGDFTSHVKGWTRPVTSGGAQSVTIDPISDEEHHAVLYVIVGASTTAPVDAVNGTSSAPSDTTWDAPSVSPARAGDLLVCAVVSQEGQTVGSFTPPSGMTEDYDDTDGGNFFSMAAAHSILTASGATGVKTFTTNGSTVAYAAYSVAIKPPPGTTVTPSAIAAVAAFPSATKSTGSTVSPSAIAAVAAFPSATKSTGSTISPSAIAASATLPAAALSTGMTVSPAVVAATATLPAATASGGATVTPAVIAAVAAFPDAVVEVDGSATIEPATIAAVAALPGPAVAVGSTVSPSAIAASATLPAASASGGATVTPAAIAAVATVPAVTVQTFAARVYTRSGGQLVPVSLRGNVRIDGASLAFG